MSGSQLVGNLNRPSLPQVNIGNQGVQSQGGVHGVQSGGVQQAPDSHPVKEVSTQLTQLLNRVSKRSTVAVDLSDVTRLAADNKKLKKLDGEFRKLQASALAVSEKLGSISSFTGMQIADAFDPQSQEWKGKVGEAIEAASAELATLSDKLLELLNHPKVAADPELHALIEEKYMKNCCRESELATVLNHAVSLKHGAEGELSAEAKAKLSQSVQTLMNELAPQMHGTKEALGAETDLVFKNLSTVLDGLKGEDRVVSEGERREIVSLVRAAKAHVHHLAAKDTTIDKSFFKEADALFGKILRELGNLKETAVSSIVKRHVDSMEMPPCLNFSKDFLAGLEEKGLCLTLVKYVRLRQTLQENIAAYAAARQNPDIPKAEIDQMRAHIEDLRQDILHRHEKEDFAQVFPELLFLKRVELFTKNPNAIPEHERGQVSAFPPSCIPELTNRMSLGDQLTTFNAVEAEVKSLRSHLGTLDKIFSQISRVTEEEVNTKQLLSTLFTEAFPISSLIECRVNGIRDGDIDLSLCDDNIVSRKAFGQGGINTVYEVTMNDGRVFIFKPECSSRSGLDALELGNGGYQSDANVAALNIAAHDAANFIGLGECIVSAKVGICNGQLGFFMEKASGVDSADFQTIQKNPAKMKESLKNHPLNGRRLAELDDAAFLKVNGQLMKKCYDLEWTDFLIGSGDRHTANYFVDISENGTVGVKGIDNDMCFPKYRTDFTEITFSEGRKEYFLMLCQNIFKAQTGEAITPSQLLARLKEAPGITVSDDGKSISIDLDKVGHPWLRDVVGAATGMRQLVPPRFIDEGLYEHLMTLDNEEAMASYQARLRDRMDQTNVDAAVARLRGAIRHARELADKGCIVKDWESLQTQERIFNLHEAEKVALPTQGFQDNVQKLNRGIKPVAVNNLYFRDFGAIAQERITKLAGKVFDSNE